MTKQEAIEAMKKGHRVTHRFFMNNEWIEMDNIFPVIKCEDGCTVIACQFWRYRTAPEWETGWSIINNN